MTKATIKRVEADFREEVNATAGHRSAIERLLDLYHGQGLLPGGDAESLRKCCPHAAECWRGAPDPNDPENAGVSLPWIGSAYFDSRVALVGMNLDNFGGLTAHYKICRLHIEALEQGQRGKDGRAFARWAMLYLRPILASLDNQPPPSSLEVENEALADLWQRCAFLEAVKCAPGSERSNPTEAMFSNCPPFLLREELEILMPRVVLIFGRTPGQTRDSIRRWAIPDGSGYGRLKGQHLERDLGEVAGEKVELISVNHPSGRSPNVLASLEQLASSIRENPVGSPPLD